MSHGEGGRSRVEGQDHVTGSECAATTTVTAAAVKVEVTKKIISASFTAATAFDTAQPALSHAGKQSRLINHPVPSTASRSSSASGDSSSCSVEDRESRWAGRSQALQQFEEELKMSVILCTAGYDHTIRFWEALSGICSRTIQHPDSQVNRLCITPDKRFLAAAGHHNVKLYDIKSTNPNPVMTFDGHTNNITGVAFHCEGKWMVTSSEDGTVKVWDTRTGSLQRNYAHRAPVNDVAIHPNQGELVSGDRAGIVRVWDLGESVCTHQLIPEEDVAVQSVSVASDGSLLCAGNKKGNVYIWRMIQDVEVTRIVPICTFQAHKDYLIRILLSPDVKHLATCSADHTAKVWNLDFDYPPAKIAAAAAAKAKARGISGPEAKSNPSTPGSSESLDPAVIQEKNRLQDLNAFRIVAGSPAPVEEPPNPFPAQPDGPPMDPTSGTPFLETVLSQHQRWVWDCAFSADSAYLVTVSSDHYARLWELNTGQVIRQYNGHHRGAVCVALNDYSEPR